MPIVGIILSQVAGVVASKALSMLFSSPDTGHETLSKFLETLSRNFLNQVEEVVRNAFIENRFDNIKASILLGHETLTRYQQSKTTKPPRGDESILNQAKHDIDKAYTKLKTQIDKILAAEANPPSEPHTRIKSFLKLIELTLLALQVLVPIDILISTHYIDLHENYQDTIVRRIDEYVATLDRLFGIYQRIQPLRVRQKEKRLYWPGGFEQNYQQFHTVWPNKDFMKDNSTYWVYSVEGLVEAAVHSARQPSDYSAYDVNYNCPYDGQNIAFSVRMDAARAKPEVGSHTLIEFLSRSAIGALAPQIETAKKIWIEAKHSIQYANIFNYLVGVTENDAPNIDLAHIKNSFSHLTQKDKNTFLCRSLRLGKKQLAQCYLTAGASIDAVDEEAKGSDENTLFMAVRSGKKELVSLLLAQPIDIAKKNRLGRTASQIRKRTWTPRNRSAN